MLFIYILSHPTLPFSQLLKLGNLLSYRSKVPAALFDCHTHTHTHTHTRYA